MYLLYIYIYVPIIYIYYIYIFIYIYIYIYIYNCKVTRNEEATEMAAKYLHNKKCAFNNLTKMTHYYNNCFEEDIYFPKSITLQ